MRTYTRVCLEFECVYVCDCVCDCVCVSVSVCVYVFVYVFGCLLGSVAVPICRSILAHVKKAASPLQTHASLARATCCSPLPPSCRTHARGVQNRSIAFRLWRSAGP